jgi:nudix motif 8
MRALCARNVAPASNAFPRLCRASTSSGDAERSQKAVSRILSLGDGSRQRDIERLVSNFTSPALASALRDREDVLCECAISLIEVGGDEGLRRARQLLEPFLRAAGAASGDGPAYATSVSVRSTTDAPPPVPKDFDAASLRLLRKRLSRMPRQVRFHALDADLGRRAGIVLPLCTVGGTPSVLFTTRSDTVRRFAGEVCFPGGMVDPSDESIVDVGLRELQEETGVGPDQVQVLGVLRCDWSELASITGVAVTPIVGFIGELEGLELRFNEDEVKHCFTVPLAKVADEKGWAFKHNAAPVFSPGNGHEPVWGLTAYVLSRFVRDILFHPIGSSVGD